MCGMKRLLFSFGSALIIVVILWIAYAVWGEHMVGPFTETEENVTPDIIAVEAQGLRVGRYLVYETHEMVDQDNIRFIYWRYRVGSQEPEKIMEITYDARKTAVMPRAEKFSDESFAVWSQYLGDTVKQLYHINGNLIGPAEDYMGLISPNRQWVAYYGQEVGAVLMDVNNEDTFMIGTHPLQPVGWSDDSTKLYLTTVGERNVFSELQVFKLDTRELLSLTAAERLGLRAVLVYAVQKKAIGMVSAGDSISQAPSSIQLIDLVSGDSKELLYNDILVMSNPLLSPSGLFFSYSYADNESLTWIASVVDPQEKQVASTVSGTALAWPSEDTLIIQRDGALLAHNWQDGSEVELAPTVSEDQQVKSGGWSFVQIFEIK